MVILDKKIAASMIAHCRKEFPNEACGILSGKAGRAEKIYEMANNDKSPSSYFMDPKEQFKAIKEMRLEGLEMIGIYHSHVATKAYPSTKDVKLAFYPSVSYLIVSLENKVKAYIRSFRIVEKKIIEEDVVIK